MYINKNIIHKLRHDSRHISLLTYIFHKLPGPGIYQGRVCLGEATIGIFEIHARETCATPQATIDLDDLLAKQQHRKFQKVYQVYSEGYVLFCTRRSNKPYWVELRQPDVEEAAAYDTRRLQAGDIYTVRLFTPGQYIAQHSDSTDKLRIEVLSPKDPRADRSAVNQPKDLQAGKEGFSDEQLTVQPMQPLVFHNRTPGYIIVEYTTSAYAKKGKS